MKTRKRNKGSVLAMVSVIVLVLSITGLSMLELAKSARLRSSKIIAELAAQNAADTGMDLGIEYVYELWNANAPDLIDIDYTSELMTLPGTRNNADFQFSVELCDDYPGYEITSIATAGVVTKEIHFRMLIQHPWVGIAAKDTININVGTGIELKPSDYSDFTLVTNQVYSNSIVLRNGVYIPGDIIVGPGGDPDMVIDTKKDAVITGETWSMLEEILYPDVTVPTLGYASLGTDPNDPAAMVMDTDGIYGAINIGAGDKLKVVGDVTAIMDGDLIVDNSGYFMITEGSSLKLYMLGNIEMKYGSIFMNEQFDAADTYEEIRDATKSLKIYGAATCTSIIFKNSSFIAGAVYAPYAFIDFRNSADYYGAVLGKDVVIKNSGNFIFVYGVYDNADRFISNLKTQKGSWWEN
jgi:hypothetical protein